MKCFKKARKGKYAEKKGFLINHKISIILPKIRKKQTHNEWVTERLSDQTNKFIDELEISPKSALELTLRQNIKLILN